MDADAGYKYADGWIIAYDYSLGDFQTGKLIDVYTARQMRGMVKESLPVYPTQADAERMIQLMNEGTLDNMIAC